MNKPTIFNSASVLYIMGKGALAKAADRLNKFERIIIITDENTAKMCLPVFKAKLPTINTTDVITIVSGEENKTVAQLIYIWQELTRLNVSRYDLVVNLGGGIVTDMGGFAAATYKRGVEFINFPTTLLGMADAAIGGKTAIDFEGFKNQIGLFVNPKSVVIDQIFLQTIDETQWQSGFAEVLKYGLISDNKLWETLANKTIKDDIDWNYVITTAAKNKINIVNVDTYEKGIRKILNFGHTVGHAIESYYLNSKKQIPHGMAVAAGIICETWLSLTILNLDHKQFSTVINTIDINFNRLNFTEIDIPAIITIMKQDKKAVGNKHNFSLITKIGKAVFDVEVSNDKVIESLKFYINRETI